VIAAVVLAAGRSERMGAPKLLLDLSGRSLLRRVIDNVRASRCQEIVVVLGAGAEEVAAEARGPGVNFVTNDRYRDGMGTSIACGIAALGPSCEAAVIVLGDQPFVGSASIDALIAAYQQSGKPIVASRYGTVAGAPTLIGRMLFAEARGLTGDVGGRALIREHPGMVVEVPLPDAAALDVDTPHDLTRADAMLRGESPTSRS
jgi:molybdenum cofactor cytidylyltransferase